MWQLTKDLISNVVLSDEIAQKLLVHTGLVDDLFAEGSESHLLDLEKSNLWTHSSVPECTPQLKCLQQHRLGFFEGQIAAQSEAKAHGAETWPRDLGIAERKCVDHFDLL